MNFVLFLYYKKKNKIMSSKLPKDYFLLEADYIKITNSKCYKLIRKINNYLLEDTKLAFDVDSENEALEIAWKHLDILGDSVLDEQILIKKSEN